MAWNQRLYRAGYDAANYTIRNLGTEAAKAEYDNLDGASAVNEFEVGYRTRLEEGIPAQSLGQAQHDSHDLSAFEV